MPFVDPVHSARGRLAYSSRTDIVQHDPNAVSNARRELTAAKLERSVREALAAAPPLTAEAAPRNTCSTRTALGDSPVQPGVGFARNLRRLQDLLEPDAVKVARPVLRGPRRSNALGLPDQRHCWPGGHSTWIHCRSVRRSVRTIAPRIRVNRRRGGGARRGMMVLPAYVAHPILGCPWSASRRLPALPSMTAVQLRDEGPGALGSHQRFALGQQADLLRAKDRDVIPRRGPPRATPSRVVAGSGNPGGRPDQVGDLAIEARATKCLPERVASPTCMTNTESS